MRRKAIGICCACIVAVAALVAVIPARAAEVPSQSVPVSVQSVPVPNYVPPIGADVAGVPTASPPTLPTPPPTPMPTIDPGTYQVPASIFHPLLTGLLQNITGKLTPFLNKVTAVGWHIYMLVAAISIALAVLQSFVLGEFSLPGLLRYLYWRLVEFGIWSFIIKYTWTGLPGGFGWFSAIVSMFVGIGSTIVGIDTSFSTQNGWNLDILPGTIADLGVGLFSAIMSMVSIGKGGLWDVLGRTMDGTVLISVALWFFGLISALWAMFVCGSIAFKYFWTIVKVYVLGCLSFIQGLGGSRRLSGIAGSYANAAIVLGVEASVTIILVGLMWHVIVGLTQALGFTQALDLVGAASGTPSGIIVSHIADLSYTAASLAVLDLVLTLWAYAMWRVPRDVAELLSGRIQVSTGELRQAFQSSPSFAARMVGHGMNTLEQGGTKGPGAALSTAVKPIGNVLGKIGDAASIGAVAGSGNGEGAAGIASGAVKGFLMGGPEGAIAGAIGSAVMSKFSRKETEGGSYSGSQEDAAEAHDERTNPNVRDAESTDGTSEVRAPAAAGASDANGTAHRNTIIEDDVTESGSDSMPSDDSGDLPRRQKTRRTQVDEELVTAMRAMTAALNSNTSANNRQNVAAAAAGGSRAATRTSSGFDPLSEMDANLSIGRMITQRAMYRQMRPQRPEPPHRDNESASLNIPLNLGNK